MGENTVTLVGTLPGAAGASYMLRPSGWVTDSTNLLLIPPKAVHGQLTSNQDGSGSLSVPGRLATDTPGPYPSGWNWRIGFSGITDAPVLEFSFFLPAGPFAFTATEGSPAVFTAPDSSGDTQLANGMAVMLSGGSLPGGFTPGTYYLVNVASTTFELAATPGASPIASTSAGSGTLRVTQADVSGLAQLHPSGSMSGFLQGIYPGTATEFLRGDGQWAAPPGTGLPLIGGTLTGPLILADTPSASPGALPIGYGDSTAITGMQIASAYPSDDVIGGTDGTGRISLYSYQRANVYSFGETIRNFLMRWDAKAMTAWYGPVSLYDGDGNAVTSGGWKPWTWVGSHYESNSHDGIHGHWEIEVPDSTGALQGRFAVPFANTVTGAVGLDLTTIYTNLANFHVYCHGTTALGAYQEQYFRLTGAAGYEKPIEWNNDNGGALTSRRWKLAANATAETGSNAGTDFYLYRYDDSGNLLDTPLTVTRSTGVVTVGGTSGTASGLVLNRNGGVALTINPLATGGQGALVIGTDTTARSWQGQVSGDTTVRSVICVDGRHEWGDGTDARDLNLYRQSAGLLRTDNSLEVVTGLGVGVAPTHKLDVSSSSAGILATFTRSSTSDSTPVVELFAGDTSTSSLLTLSVNNDSVNRFAVDPTGKITWGDGTDARDVELYRTSANVIGTDHWFRATQGLRINTTSVGGGVGVLAMAQATTAPASNPTSNGVVIYVDSSGNLLCRTSAGNVRTLAAV